MALSRRAEPAQLPIRTTGHVVPPMGSTSLLQAVPIADYRGQARAVFGLNKHANGLSHTPRLACSSPNVNRTFVSVHDHPKAADRNNVGSKPR